jgi:hypothetical protein
LLLLPVQRRRQLLLLLPLLTDAIAMLPCQLLLVCCISIICWRQWWLVLILQLHICLAFIASISISKLQHSTMQHHRA